MPEMTILDSLTTNEVLVAIKAYTLAPNRGPLATVDGITYSPEIDAPLKLAKALVAKANKERQVVHVTISNVPKDPKMGRRPGCDVLVAPGDNPSSVQFDIMAAYAAA